MHISTYINIDSITAGSLHGSCRCKDIESGEFHAVALIEVCGPERRVDEAYTLKLHIIAALYEHQSGAHLLQIGTLTVILATDPELLPVAQAITIDCAFA